MGLSQFMSPRRVRVERGVMPCSPLGVENKQPGLARRIEASRRDQAKLTSGRLLPTRVRLGPPGC